MNAARVKQANAAPDDTAGKQRQRFGNFRRKLLRDGDDPQRERKRADEVGRTAPCQGTHCPLLQPAEHEEKPEQVREPDRDKGERRKVEKRRRDLALHAYSPQPHWAVGETARAKTYPNRSLNSYASIKACIEFETNTARNKRAPPGERPSNWQMETRSALRELEGPAGLGAAVLLALNDARVAGEEAAALERAAQPRLEIGQRLGKTMPHSAGLSPQTTARHCADDVILPVAPRRDEGLLDQHAKHRTGKEHLDRPGVHFDLAGARLDPHAGDRVFALAGRIGAALRINSLLVLGGLWRGRLQAREAFQGLYGLGHDQALLTFLRFMAATSSFSGFCASCGCSAPG